MDRIFEKIGLEWQYVLWSATYPYRFKVGRSTSFDARISSIKYTMSSEAGKEVHVRLFIKMPVMWAGKNEKTIHNFATWWPARNMPGNGRTEWTWGINVFTMLAVWIGSFAFGYPKALSLLAVAAPFPLDLALFTILLAVFQYTLAGLALYGLWNLFF